ncbi:MAG: ThuA domain-containing protein [Verrucomicrobiales bacterium]|nr:ThuA domain-containing protein [Verrucomicrobiales bacterium]
MKRIICWLGMFAGLLSLQAAPWVTYEGKEGPGHGRHIVFLAGDEEYRSEQGLPMLARILAIRHGFKCTVLFSTDTDSGEIAPNDQVNMPGLDHLKDADLVVMLLRFREWPDAEMKKFVDYYLAGKPIVALRTSTHAFAYNRDKQSPYAKYDYRGNQDWPGGFGQQVLGDTWINHHGNHGVESTRGILNPAEADNPILRGVSDIWGPTDVYGLKNYPADATTLVFGQVLKGMHPDDEAVAGPKNDPMMPVAWTRVRVNEARKTNRIFTTTMGASVDLANAGLRRLVVNACYWAVGLEGEIPAASNVEVVGDYNPTIFGFNKYIKGVKASDLELKP